MAIVSREELNNSLQSLIGAMGTDESLAFLENYADTMSDLEARASDTTDWKAKYEQNDADWRKRYTERFFAPVDTPITTPIDVKREHKEDVKKDGTQLSFEDLFNEREV